MRLAETQRARLRSSHENERAFGERQHMAYGSAGRGVYGRVPAPPTTSRAPAAGYGEAAAARAREEGPNQVKRYLFALVSVGGALGMLLAAFLAVFPGLSHVSAASASVAPNTVQKVWQTQYAARDNDPPGSRAIAYPSAAPRHSQATADLGTYAHPITLASDQRWLPVGSIVYAPRWHKYYIMEDQCVECEADWGSKHFHHVDLYISDSVQPGVIQAEDAATKNQAENDVIVLNPSPNFVVDTTPLYTDAGGAVWAKHQYGDALITTSAPAPTTSTTSAPAPAATSVPSTSTAKSTPAPAATSTPAPATTTSHAATPTPARGWAHARWGAQTWCLWRARHNSQRSACRWRWR